MAARARDDEFNYYTESKSLGLSIVSILPLVVIYHLGIVQRGHSVRIMAEVWLEGPLGLIGLQAAHLLNIAVVVALIAVLWRGERAGGPNLLVVLIMVAEGALYALALHRGGGALTDAVYSEGRQIFFAARSAPSPLGAMQLGPLRLDAPAELMLALGAGVYEELVFRLLLIGGGSFALSRLFDWNEGLTLAIAVIVSALLFSAMHHVGPFGDDFRTYTFLFRAVCGFLLGLIFVLRGFGVAVWTHAVYNALIVLTM